MPFYGQWDPPVDEVILRNYFPDKKDGFFIECGAGNGVLDACCLFFEQSGWKGINIEPSGPAFERLAKNRPDSVNLRIGLGDRDRKATFTKAVKNGYGGGCIEWHPKFKQEVMAEGYAFEDCEIEVATYGTVISKYGVPHVDLFVLDVDGYELEVVKGMPLTQPGPDVICVEYPLVGLENLKTALSVLGYRFDFISFNNAFFALKSVPDKDPFQGCWWGATGIMDY